MTETLQIVPVREQKSIACFFYLGDINASHTLIIDISTNAQPPTNNMVVNFLVSKRIRALMEP